MLAAASGAALILAIPFILGHSSIELQRIITPVRVTVGERSLAEMRTTNRTSRRSAAVVIQEQVAGTPTSIDVPALGADQSAEFLYALPTDKRGVYPIGPATISRGDPLGLLRRPVGETGVETLWVHPRTIPTKALASGFAKDLEGPTFDTSPAGDIAFHTIREYQPGDDVRHVHWMSTARKGTLMVRHYVDNRRPQVTAVVDPTLATGHPWAFEIALEVAGSLGASAILRETQVSVRVGTSALVGHGVAAGIDDLLDSLSAASAAPGESLEDALASATAHEHATSVLVVITCGRDTDELLRLVEPFRRQVQVVVVNIHDDDQLIALPRVTVINARTLDEFGAAWDRLA